MVEFIRNYSILNKSRANPSQNHRFNIRFISFLVPLLGKVLFQFYLFARMQARKTTPIYYGFLNFLMGM